MFSIHFILVFFIMHYGFKWRDFLLIIQLRFCDHTISFLWSLLKGSRNLWWIIQFRLCRCKHYKSDMMENVIYVIIQWLLSLTNSCVCLSIEWYDPPYNLRYVNTLMKKIFVSENNKIANDRKNGNEVLFKFLNI